MTSTRPHAIFSFLAAHALGVAVLATGCSDTATSGDMASTTDMATSSKPPLMLGMTLHLENKTFDSAYFASLNSFAASFEKHGGKLTLEPRDVVVSAAAGPPLLFDWKTLEARGHAVGSHAGIGDTTATTLTQFTTQAKMRYDQLLPRVQRLEHISGNCGNVDWVKGVSDAGFKFTTAATVLCLYSMAQADRPAPYQTLNCTSPTDPTCHKSYPSDLTQRVHPWRAQDSGHWLTDSATGPLVIFPGSGTLPCLQEEATSSGTSLPTCTLTQEDVTRALAELDQAITLVDPNKINTFYWVWGSWSLSAQEQPILDTFLSEVDKRIAKGQVRWASMSEMYSAYLSWEKTHR